MTTSKCVPILASLLCVPTDLLTSVLVVIPHLTGNTVAHQIAKHVLNISVEDHLALGHFD